MSHDATRTLIDNWRDEWHLEPGPEQTTLEPCKWCAEGDKPKFLDADGTLVSITGNDGVMCHAYEEYWWPCLKFGVEMRCARVSAASTAPVVDDVIALLEQAMQLNTSIGCSCDRAEGEPCSGDCAESRVWQLIHKARKLLRAAAASPAAPARCQCGAEKDDPIHSTSTEFQESHAFTPAAPQNYYEQALTVNWEATNARRHELILKKPSGLTEGEATELRELQWLAGIKRELGSGPLPAAPQEDADEKRQAAIALLDKWLAQPATEDDSFGDELRRRIDENRLSDRKFWPELSAPTPSQRARDAAREILATVLGFNEFDDLGTLPPDHGNRRHVEREIATIISRYFPAGTETDGELGESKEVNNAPNNQ